MLFMCLLLVPGADDPVETLAKKMLPIYVQEASDYVIAADSAPKKALELKKEPVFEWSNPTREGLQQGVVFVWLRDGRPAAIGSIFSQPHDKPAGRQLNHEFHLLDPEKLIVTRPKGVLNEWKPQAGPLRKKLAESPADPGATTGTRLIQMKKLAAEFTGHTIDPEKKRWDLRLLPTPLYRYPTARTGVIDGALFALVTNAGTDPEVLVLIEAREDKAGKFVGNTPSADSPTATCTFSATTRNSGRASATPPTPSTTIRSISTAFTPTKW